MATPTKSKVPAKVEEKSTAVMTAAPPFMKQDSGKGMENLKASDLEIPRLILLQSLSPQVTEGDERPGTFYHTILEEAIGEKGQPLRIVPIFADIKFILWRPRHEGGGILARADQGPDGEHNWVPANQVFEVKPYKDRPTTVKWETKDTVRESGLDKFGSMDPADPNSQPAAVKMWNFVVVLPDHAHLGPMVLTLQRGGAKTGANFSSKLKFDGNGAPAFGQVFEMNAKMDNTGSGDFYNLGFTKVGYVENEDEYNTYKSLYERFSKDGVKIKDLEGAQDDNDGATGKQKGKLAEGGIEA